jgi:hypothetical protein
VRYKPVPSPAAGVSLAAAQSAVPLVPETTDDCCARLVTRTDIPSADVARTWLTFLQALGLARETGDGFVRTDREPTAPAIGTAFRERVYGAAEVLEVLEAATEPLPAVAVYSAVDLVPRWEGHREQDPEAVWQERVGHLLEWAVRLGLARDTDAGYSVEVG